MNYIEFIKFLKKIYSLIKILEKNYDLYNIRDRSRGVEMEVLAIKKNSMCQYLVTTSFEKKKYIKNLKEEKIYHLSDNSQNFNYFNYKKKFNSKKASLAAQKYCSMMADKIFEKIYFNLLNHYKIKLSKKIILHNYSSVFD